MTKEELISHYCDYRGKCTTDDVAALTFAYRMLAPRWISVEDELPEVYEPVLAAAGSHFAVVAIRDNFDWYDSKFGGEKISGITHWQRLPAPPKKGGKQ